jgi:hypothetical protein
MVRGPDNLSSKYSVSIPPVWPATHGPQALSPITERGGAVRPFGLVGRGIL